MSKRASVSCDGEIVTLGCSNGIHHSPTDHTKTSSQNMGRIYRTELEALTAARIYAFKTFHKRLGEIDTMIAKAKSK